MAVYADSDRRVSGRTIARRREADIRFLAELRTVRTLEHILRIEDRERRWGAPKWRRIAIDRVKRRVTDSPSEVKE